MVKHQHLSGRFLQECGHYLRCGQPLRQFPVVYMVNGGTLPNCLRAANQVVPGAAQLNGAPLNGDPAETEQGTCGRVQRGHLPVADQEGYLGADGAPAG